MQRILVSGATGYIGGRLVPELLSAGYQVRCLARTPAKLAGHSWRDKIEVAAGDITDPAAVEAAMSGVDAAYFLVHSLGGGEDFAAADRRAAEVFREAAAAAGTVTRVIYLGGLGDERDAELSKHLGSRHEVGRVLADALDNGDASVPVTELRAAVIIGSGSASFEMLRNLTEVLPIMVAPKWIETRCQPISIGDILAYLVAVLGAPATAGRILEVGGPDVVTYHQMMDIYAEVAGLHRRHILGVPVLSPQLSSYWIGLVTPIPVSLAQPLVQSLVNEVIVHDHSVDQLLPRDNVPFRQALEDAVAKVRDLAVDTNWAGAELRTVPAHPRPTDPSWSGGTVLSNDQTVHANASPERVFATVCGLGGKRGWYAAGSLWQLRGLLDIAVGGIGLRRGRRLPDQLRVGDPVDFWRVEEIEPDRYLLLRAEMRLPGEAWLEFHVEPDGAGSRLEQRARFTPRGLWGRVYWYSLLPFHAVIFKPMALRIAEAAALPPGAVLKPRRLLSRRPTETAVSG